MDLLSPCTLLNSGPPQTRMDRDFHHVHHVQKQIVTVMFSTMYTMYKSRHMVLPVF